MSGPTTEQQLARYYLLYGAFPKSIDPLFLE